MQFVPNKPMKMKGKTDKAKLTLKGLSNSVCTLATSVGVERELEIYIYIKKKKKWMGFNSKRVGIEGFDKERKSPER